MDNRWEMNPINLDISRSKQKINYTIPTSFNLGELIPLDVIEVLPGSTHSFDVDSLVRMSTPIAPLMSDIYLDLYAFFVPNRLVWEHWEEFCGANKTGAWFDTEADYAIPAVNIGAADLDDGDFDLVPGLSWPYSYGTALGCYLGINFGSSSSSKSGLANVSVLEGRGYFLIYNEWFRNENFIAPYAIAHDSSSYILVDEGDVNETYFSSYLAAPLKVSKFMDIFTGCLPAPQKGDSVYLPITGFAPVDTDPTGLGAGYEHNPMTWVYATTGTQISPVSTSNLTALMTSGATAVNAAAVVPNNLVVNLAESALLTVNQLRYSFAVQKALEKDARGGTRYWEMLKAHFSVTSPDATLQRPEYLGGKRIPINIQQVVSTAGHANSSSTSLGVPGANSVTGDNAHLFTKSFTEFGFIYIMCCARMKEVYSQGTKRQYYRQNRFDYYYPVFANIGEQPIYTRELYNRPKAVGDLVGPNDIFGYQEAWAEYRYIPSRVSGVLNPAYNGSLSFWTAAEVFDPSSTLSIGQTFMEADRTALTRCLVTGDNGPDFVADFAVQDVAVLPMPLYSIPGLIDHH